MIDYLVFVASAMLAALVVDYFLGEARRYHPLVGFGRLAKYLESALYPATDSPLRLWGAGLLAWLLAVMPLFIAALVIVQLLALSLGLVSYWLVSVAVIYFAIGAKSLQQHAEAISEPLVQGDLESARRSLSMLVSRDTDSLNETEIATAAIESVVENSHDSVIGVFFWFLLFGVPGVILFRLANTLDAMWGYRNTRYNYFGRWAARIDDVLGFVSARLTVLLFALQKWPALTAAWHYGRTWYSPNAGPVMAAGAGALAVKLGGDQHYQGQIKARPTLGDGLPAQAKDIDAALTLVRNSYYLMPILLLSLAAGLWLLQVEY